MSDYINTFCATVKCDLAKRFEYSNEYIGEFLLKLEEYFKNNVNNELSNYHELKNFLGQKRKEKNQQKIIKDDKYFKQDIENYSINKDENEDIKLKIKDKKNRIDNLI